VKSLDIVAIPEEVIISKIYLVRGINIMLDLDLANLFGVETKQLKRSVRRNLDRFPQDFMFELSKQELANWRSQFGTSNREKMGVRRPPFAFTEHGVLMLSSVLTSPRAVQVNIQIVRIFNKMKKMLLSYQNLMTKIESLEKLYADHDDKIILIFEYVKQLEKMKIEETDFHNRRKIGFKIIPGKE